MDKFTKKTAFKPIEEKRIILDIGRLDDSLRGVAYIGAKRYAVNGALPKEKVSAVVKKTENNISYAEVKSVIEPSPERVEPPCPYYGRCSGCQLLHVDYDAGLKHKTALVKKKLWSLGVREVADCISMGKTACRNKVHIAFWKKTAGVEIGFFNDDTHNVINVKECLLHGSWYTDLVKILRVWVTEFDITIYDTKTCKGHLRFAAARYIGGFLMLTIVSSSPAIKNLEELYNMLKVRFPKVSLWLSVNTEKTNEVMAGRITHIAGYKKLAASMLGIKFELSPHSFFQVNEKVAEVIYTKATDLIKESGTQYVIDAYSGIGITSALFAKAGLNVISIESTADAVRDAKALCSKNEISGVTHLCGDIADILPTLKPEGKTAFFIDPPRSGLGEQVTNSIIQFCPDLILYLSCNPSSLVQDLTILTENDYTITSITPCDMFPNTRHVETLVCIKKTNR